MRHNIAAFVAALILSIALTPLARRLAFHLGAVSRPGGRHVHGRAIPRLGGLAILFGFLLPLLGSYAVDASIRELLHQQGREFLAVVAGGVLLCCLGALDDIRGLRVAYKLIGQCGAAILAFACGLRIEAVALPGLGNLPMGVFALPVTMLWIVGVTNAVNLIDGLDGLAAGVAFFAAFTSFVIAFISGSPFVALLMATLMGALIGFLFFNFNPARIFMGDSGSYFLGFLLATLSLTGALQQKASTAVSLLVPIIALGLPIFDTLFSMVRRYLARRPLLSADRGHVHHRLLELGLTHRRAVLLLYGVSIVLAAGAIGVSLGRSWEVGVALFCVSTMFVGLVRFLGYFDYFAVGRRERLRSYDLQTQKLRNAVPRLLLELYQTMDEAAALAALGRVVEATDIDVIELFSDTQIVRRWQKLGFDPGARELIQATYPMRLSNRVETGIRFTWRSAAEENASHVDILLQLAVDAVSHALGQRQGTSFEPSSLARAPEPTMIPSQSLPLK